MTDFSRGRHAGVLLPLFSMPSSRSWGIGEILDLVPFCAWLRQAGADVLQLLPVNEMSTGEHSPYSAISAMAIDPIYISVWAVAEHVALGGEASLSSEDGRRLAEAREGRQVNYHLVRALKRTALRAAFERFVREEWSQESSRAAGFAEYRRDEAWWLEDYALYRALRGKFGNAAWWEWEGGVAARDSQALSESRRELSDDILYQQYLQWIATTQWHAARKRVAPVGLFGDLPFMVGRDSADVWARQHAFDTSATVGTPPDAFSETGQDWGLPVYRWDVFEREQYAWIRERARRAADLFSGYRVDHVVGFYRTYVIPEGDGDRRFHPADVRAQRALGERVMRTFAEPGARIIAEDLGTVPEFVRASLTQLGIPGYKVLRWERRWDEPGRPFTDPTTWPACSVATTGTHDTESLAEWWENAPPAERELVAAIPTLAGRPLDLAAETLTARTRDILLEFMYGSASDLLLLPIQDIFGWRDRINTPGTVGDDNWTYRLPWPVDRLEREPDAAERATVMKRWAGNYGRLKV